MPCLREKVKEELWQNLEENTMIQNGLGKGSDGLLLSNLSTEQTKMVGNNGIGKSNAIAELKKLFCRTT